MSKRDPRIDPHEGDVLRQKNGRCELLVDLVRDGWVYYRVTDGKGGLIAARKMVMQDWCREALENCKENDRQTTTG